jgi:pyruvyltransferase
MARKIGLFWWRSRKLTQGNFGDELTQPILERVIGIETERVAMHKAELIGAGSILGLYNNRTRGRPLRRILDRFSCERKLHVWGSGIHRASDTVIWPQALSFSAVRGELTRDKLGLSTLPLGDPGILASRLVAKTSTITHAIGIIPHFSEFEIWMKRDFPKHWKIINPTLPVTDVLKQIASSELILSSSLHGLITSDSYGIPCVWLKRDVALKELEFKYRDHASARGFEFNSPISIGEVLSLTKNEIMSIATTPTLNINNWQDSIIRAFPRFF